MSSDEEDKPSIPYGKLAGAILVLAAAVGSGSMLGVTIEPEETTQMRIDYGKLEVQVDSLTTSIEEQEKRIALLEGIIDECNRMIERTRERE